MFQGPDKGIGVRGGPAGEAHSWGGRMSQLHSLRPGQGRDKDEPPEVQERDSTGRSGAQVKEQSHLEGEGWGHTYGERQISSLLV